MTTIQGLRNVAKCVLEYTETVRHRNGRGKCRTYAANVDAIAGAARQLAEAVLELHPPAADSPDRSPLAGGAD